MLRQRVLTAVLLLLVLLPALFYPSAPPFALLALVFIAAAAWEWSRLAGLGQGGALLGAAVVVSACALTWNAGWLQQSLQPFWLAVALLWLVAGVVLLRGGVPLWLRLWPVVRLGLGLFVLFAAWLAVAQARHAGINFLLSIMALVWAADIAAYFVGRAWGGRLVRRKLAPSISPGKTWEGALGGVLGSVLLAFCWMWLDRQMAGVSPSLYSQLQAAGGWLMVPAIVCLCAMSVVGDLIESLLKRAAGKKDSSGLLPGHGGVLDRIDALLPTMPLAMLLHGL